MILVDFSQICISSLYAQIGIMKTDEVNEDFLRHLILNSLRSIRSKFKHDYGELVLAFDSNKTQLWRKEAFPYYKANRKKERDESKLDWNMVFSCINNMKDDLREFFPYIVIEVAGAEADDVIGTLAGYKGNEDMDYGEPILIVSADKDFIQLQKYKNLKQYDPIRERWLTGDPVRYLFEHILRGDTGDGVPNFLSADDCLVTKTRQKSVFAKKIDEWFGLTPQEFCNEEQLTKYKRNELLIDLSKTPTEIKEKIIESYENCESRGRSKIYDYMIAKKLKNLIDYCQDF